LHFTSLSYQLAEGEYAAPYVAAAAAAGARARDTLMEALHVAPGSYGHRRYSSIIVLDEIDMLMTRDQAVSTGRAIGIQR
jgi:hypothetical protein